jgi:hypothetical protein
LSKRDHRDHAAGDDEALSREAQIEPVQVLGVPENDWNRSPLSTVVP